MAHSLDLNCISEFVYSFEQIIGIVSSLLGTYFSVNLMFQSVTRLLRPEKCPSYFEKRLQTVPRYGLYRSTWRLPRYDCLS